MDEEKTIITKKEYHRLLKVEEFANALRSAGVVNWEGFPDAMEILAGFDD